MKRKIYPSSPQGILTVPPSKSMAHRLLIGAALANGVSVIDNVAFSQDILATMDGLTALGASFEVKGNAVTVTGCGGTPRANSPLPCGESGSTLRFLLPLCLLNGGGVLTGSERLLERPLSVYEELCSARGISFTRTEKEVCVQGTLTGGDFALPGDVSSQFITGLLFALPLLREDSRIVSTTPLESASYLLLTLSALGSFGIQVTREDERTFFIAGNQSYRPCNASVEGDESNAAFLGALNLWGSVSVEGRNPQTQQGDGVWEVLFPRLKEGFCTVSVLDCPDLAPILMTVAASCHGCRLTDTRRLKIKESDRGVAMAEELAKFGAKITLEENSILVEKTPLHAPEIPLNGHNDHRVVMSLAILSVRYGGMIDGAEAVKKSFPDFFEKLQKANVRIETL